MNTRIGPGKDLMSVTGSRQIRKRETKVVLWLTGESEIALRKAGEATTLCYNPEGRGAVTDAMLSLGHSSMAYFPPDFESY